MRHNSRMQVSLFNQVATYVPSAQFSGALEAVWTATATEQSGLPGMISHNIENTFNTFSYLA